jgi:hypothetical protein
MLIPSYVKHVLLCKSVLWHCSSQKPLPQTSWATRVLNPNFSNIGDKYNSYEKGINIFSQGGWTPFHIIFAKNKNRYQHELTITTNWFLSKGWHLFNTIIIHTNISCKESDDGHKARVLQIKHDIKKGGTHTNPHSPFPFCVSCIVLIFQDPVDRCRQGRRRF